MLVNIYGNIMIERHRSQVLPRLNIAVRPDERLSTAFDALKGHQLLFHQLLSCNFFIS